MAVVWLWLAAISIGARPNLLVALMDDQGYGDCGAYWKTDVLTPTMDGIARRGIRFTQFRVNPLCAPTRASLLTGLYSPETGLWRAPNDRPVDGKKKRKAEEAERDSTKRLRDDVLLLPQLLQRAGYVTGMFGKWHLGYDTNSVPNARGFDEFVGFLAGSHAYWLGRNSKMLRNGKPLAATGHATDLFADRAIAFIRTNRHRPFFCYLPFNAVHGPLRNEERDADSGRPDWLQRYAERGVPQPRRDYNAVLSHADARLGDVLRTLDELGLRTNTFVICLSDNGGILHTYPASNGPLRGGKGTTYEGGIRVPAVMEWPGVIPPGSVSAANAVHFDLFATILEAAGAAVPERNGPFAVSGVSLLPVLRSGGRTDLPARTLFWDLSGRMAAVHGAWKIVGEIPNHHGRFKEAARTAEGATFELFHLTDDLAEANDVAAAHPAIRDEQRAALVRWFEGFSR